MINPFIATLAAAADPQTPSSGYFIVQLVALAAIFYFLLIRPQQKRQKAQAAMISSVKIGDKVVMSSGLHGMIANVKEATVVVKVADNVKLEFDKAAIASVVKSATDAE